MTELTAEDLQAEVEAALWDYDPVRDDLEEIRVEARADGTVEISGYVRTSLLKDGILSTVQLVPGVNAIQEQITDDYSLEVQLGAALSGLEGLPPGVVSVQSHLGVVTVLGELDDEEMQERVLSLVSGTQGVRSVIDRMGR